MPNISHRLSFGACLGIALATFLASCTLITNGRIEDVIDCTGQPDGTPCGNQFSDGVDRVCMAEACVATDGGVGGGQLDTVITSHPSNPSGADVVFQFDASRPSATFECHRDDLAFVPCTSPWSINGLLDGPHAFYVRAIDGDETDPTPAQYGWTVDITRPDTVIESGPGATTGPDVTFTFSGNLATSFECKLEPTESEFSSCTSPMMYADLPEVAAPGYVFSVRAITAEDLADDTPAEQAFVVDATGPEVEVSGTPGTGATTNTQANLTFSVFPSEPSVTFACRFNSAATFTDCTAGFSTSGLIDGLQTLRIIATDRFGNEGPIRMYSWTIAAVGETTIHTIRTLPVAEHTRVRVRDSGTNALRMTHHVSDHFWAQQSQSGAAYTGITVYPSTFNPSDPQNVMAAFIEVIGTVRQLDGNTALVDATFEFEGFTGSVNSLYIDDGSVLNQEQNEGLLVSTGGTFFEGDPDPCVNTDSHINACDGGTVCPEFPTGVFPPGNDNVYTGVLEGASGGYILQVFEAQDQNDICL